MMICPDCSIDHNELVKRWPAGSQVRAIVEIGVYGQSNIKVGAVGHISYHTDDGRPVIDFGDKGVHSFHQPERFLSIEVPSEPPTLPDLLARLATARPAICQRVKPAFVSICYVIGEYEFYLNDDELAACCQSVYVTGRPALAWLADALKTAIDPAHTTYKTHSWRDGLPYAAAIFSVGREDKADGNSEAEALLAALVAWTEGVGG